MIPLLTGGHVTSPPTRRKHLYTLVMLGVLGLFFLVGGINELVANVAPHLMPQVVSQTLEQAGYDTLHAHPVVMWWTRIHNLCNILIGFVILTSLRGLHTRRRAAWQRIMVCLGYVLVSGVIGSIIIVAFLFPVLDMTPSPVSPDVMKASMIAGPLALLAVALIKGRFLWRHRAHYGVVRSD